MRRYVKKTKGTKLPPQCECGRLSTVRMNSAWQCARCAAIKPDDYHRATAGLEQGKVLSVSANRLLAEWKAGNK